MSVPVLDAAPLDAAAPALDAAPPALDAALPALDALRRCGSGWWEHGAVSVRRVAGPRTVRVRRRTDARLQVSHGLLPADLDERVVPGIAAQVADVEELSAVLTGVVLSTVADPRAAWTRYYRQSLAQLRAGSAAFAPVHAHALALVRGPAVLELGSCFGFLALAAAARGHAVTASDVSAGTTALLAAVAPRLGVPLGTLTCDAAAVPRPGASSDTVLAVHLLEHLDPDHGARVLGEALRLARRRVVVAVPFEPTPDTAYGHVRTFTAAHLRALGADAGPGWTVDVHEHHGGWLVLDRSPLQQTGRP